MTPTPPPLTAGDIADKLSARIESAKAEHEKMGHPGEAALVLSVGDAAELLSIARQYEEAKEFEQDLNAVGRALGQPDDDGRTLVEYAKAAEEKLRAAARVVALARCYGDDDRRLVEALSAFDAINQGSRGAGEGVG